MTTPVYWRTQLRSKRRESKYNRLPILKNINRKGKGMAKIEGDWDGLQNDQANIFKFFFFDVKNYIQIKGNGKLAVKHDRKTLKKQYQTKKKQGWLRLEKIETDYETTKLTSLSFSCIVRNHLQIEGNLIITLVYQDRKTSKRQFKPTHEQNWLPFFKTCYESRNFITNWP